MTRSRHVAGGMLLSSMVLLPSLACDRAVPALGAVPQVMLSDSDGNRYATVAIGTQVWMAENLRVTHHRDGTTLPNVTDAGAWSGLRSGAYCWYENNTTHKDRAGALYNFFAVADVRGLCPADWHVPTDIEWATLHALLGGQAVAGGKMKSVVRTDWNRPNTRATNESGFSGIAGGGRGRRGEFGELGNYGTWWSSTPRDESHAWHRGLETDTSVLTLNSGHKASGFSIRCVKD